VVVVRLSQWAEEQGERLLAPLGRRWTHSQAVAERARAVADVVAEDHDLLVAAAYLHDVGYAEKLAVLRFHPLDGARWLADRGYGRLAGLVANHSGSRHEAELRGLGEELAQFPDEASAVTAALAYCDLTTGPGGESMTPEERRADVEARHGFDSLVALGLRRAWPELMAAVAMTEERLRQDRCAQPM
jgi:putative nucleotidyltransferase with HDIG domain